MSQRSSAPQCIICLRVLGGVEAGRNASQKRWLPHWPAPSNRLLALTDMNATNRFGTTSMTTRLLRPERIDLAAWFFANDGPQSEEIGRKVSAELVESLSYDDACDAAFGATAPDDLDVEATDIVVTLPFGLTEDDWEGPVLAISLDDVVQAQIDDLDTPEGGSAEVEDLTALCDGLRALVQKLDEALSRNALKLATRDRRQSPMW
jgi:hypothetical protein